MSPNTSRSARLPLNVFESIDKLHDRFEKPSDFSVETYLESSFGLVKEDPFDVEIIFAADVAEYVRCRVWHPSQQCRELEGGRIRMNLHVGGEFELVSWIMSFGPSAYVVSPERLLQPCGARACTSSGKLQEGNHGRSSEKSSQSGSSQSRNPESSRTSLGHVARKHS